MQSVNVHFNLCLQFYTMCHCGDDTLKKKDVCGHQEKLWTICFSPWKTASSESLCMYML